MLETSVCPVISFWRKSHCGAVASPSPCGSVVGSTGVPCQSHQHWAIASIIVVIFLHQQMCDLVIHFLVIGLRGLENTLGLPRAAFRHKKLVYVLLVEVVEGSCTGSGNSGSTQVYAAS